MYGYKGDQCLKMAARIIILSEFELYLETAHFSVLGAPEIEVQQVVAGWGKPRHESGVGEESFVPLIVLIHVRNIFRVQVNSVEFDVQIEVLQLHGRQGQSRHLEGVVVVPGGSCGEGHVVDFVGPFQTAFERPTNVPPHFGEQHQQPNHNIIYPNLRTFDQNNNINQHGQWNIYLCINSHPIL